MKLFALLALPLLALAQEPGWKAIDSGHALVSMTDYWEEHNDAARPVRTHGTVYGIWDAATKDFTAGIVSERYSTGGSTSCGWGDVSALLKQLAADKGAQAFYKLVEESSGSCGDRKRTGNPTLKLQTVGHGWLGVTWCIHDSNACVKSLQRKQ